MVERQKMHNLLSYQNYITNYFQKIKQSKMKQRQNFALPTVTNSTYAGEAASGYIAAALLSAATLDK